MVLGVSGLARFRVVVEDPCNKYKKLFNKYIESDNINSVIKLLEFVISVEVRERERNCF